MGKRTFWKAQVALVPAATLLIGHVLSAQTGAPAKPSGPTAVAPPAPGATSAPPPAEAYNYKPDGRRDPFVSLFARGIDPTGQGRGPSTSINGLMVGEVSVRGIVQSRGRYVAMVQSPDGKTYIVHANDRFLDGVIKQITLQGLLVLQDVNDPLSLEKQREVRKNLRSAEEGK